MTVAGRAANRTLRPITLSSPPNQLCHKRKLISTTSGVFGRSSAAVKKRPR